MIKENLMPSLVLAPSDYRRLNKLCGPLNQNIEAIKFTHFTSKDVIRHPLVQKIIYAYENHQNND